MAPDIRSVVEVRDLGGGRDFIERMSEEYASDAALATPAERALRGSEKASPVPSKLALFKTDGGDNLSTDALVDAENATHELDRFFVNADRPELATTSPMLERAEMKFRSMHGLAPDSKKRRSGSVKPRSVVQQYLTKLRETSANINDFLAKLSADVNSEDGGRLAKLLRGEDA